MEGLVFLLLYWKVLYLISVGSVHGTNILQFQVKMSVPCALAL